ncbi:MAG: phosphoglucosamine mutase [Cryomorphaceae bacterium]|nr:phosphoglucosamine mutase [Cryomorphaceae bacterium]MBT4222742.1 phosphoglucosamine mutase [Cryomorphaceae bacterium]MBT4293167.1 phosphoglucosamine mutase [Cryomorphaceae bacterium]MBT4833990.1 phosphoglucosamine mutase [Cryomorphaceae bacterium]MBT5936320.1 phosphoglucosamine mutase [Cryomorphaceae bacterium]
MTLIKNISGFRGTIGGENNNNLTPVDIVSSIAGFSKLIKENNPNNNLTVMTGRDGRKSGEMIQNIVNSVFSSMGINVIDAGLSTTPTLCWGVLNNDSVAGLMITASHNPQEYNGLKFFNSEGEFLSKEDVTKVIEYSKLKTYDFAPNASLGTINKYDHLIDDHIEAIINLEILPLKRIKELNLYVVADAINSGGAIALPKLLEKLNIRYKIINSEIEGVFNHTPEPLEENLKDLSQEIIKNNADFGIAVDPDVDRLVFFDENGKILGEEYTQVFCSDFVLSINNGDTVSTLSSSNALKDLTKSYGSKYYFTPVGEMNVVKKMKEVNSVVGGEGGGGIIYPELHYGRDALVGVALFLGLLVKKECKISDLKNDYPEYFMKKLKVLLKDDKIIDKIFQDITVKYSDLSPNTDDGVRIDFEDGWVHMRKSNTEPIVRIFSESSNQSKADNLALKIQKEILSLSN